MWGPGPRSRSRLDTTQPGCVNLRPASAVGTPNSFGISAATQFRQAGLLPEHDSY